LGKKDRTKSKNSTRKPIGEESDLHEFRKGRDKLKRTGRRLGYKKGKLERSPRGLPPRKNIKAGEIRYNSEERIKDEAYRGEDKLKEIKGRSQGYPKEGLQP